MAIINKFQIRSYKEIIVNVSPGTIEDGGFSTFNLDDPSVYGRFGTSDFSGVINAVEIITIEVKSNKIRFLYKLFNSYKKSFYSTGAVVGFLKKRLV